MIASRVKKRLQSEEASLGDAGRLKPLEWGFTEAESGKADRAAGLGPRLIVTVQHSNALEAVEWTWMARNSCGWSHRIKGKGAAGERPGSGRGVARECTMDMETAGATAAIRMRKCESEMG